jgi:hypothetical protein
LLSVEQKKLQLPRYLQRNSNTDLTNIQAELRAAVKYRKVHLQEKEMLYIEETRGSAVIGCLEFQGAQTKLLAKRFVGLEHESQRNRLGEALDYRARSRCPTG